LAREDPTFESEEELVERAKTDPGAFGILYERYVGRVYTYVFYRTGNPHDAEDLTARVFYKAMAGLRRYKRSGAPFASWLYRIAHNLVANWYRDRNRHQVVSLDELALAAKEQHSPDRMAEMSEETRALREAIARLSPERQQLLILKFAEGMPQAQIGQIMGRSEGAIKALYRRT
jgi:RNA polymerase sigma-70 factor (ECF subfamily)